MYSGIYVGGNKIHKVMYFPIFMLARFLLILIPLIFYKISSVQLILVSIKCYVFFGYIINFKPHDNAYRYYIEIFNKIMIYFLVMLLYMITDINPDYELQHKICGYILRLIVFFVLVNITYIVYLTIKKAVHDRIYQKLLKARLNELL